MFEKLRELNNKLNNQNEENRKNLKNPNQNDRWRFIYLLKNELFEDQKERVKFFEQTISVLPHVTTANSGDKLQEELSKYKIDSKLFRIIGAELDDERLLLSIANDFEHHKYLMRCDDNNQLLALIAYKNFNPREFNQLQNGKDGLAELRKEFREIISEQLKDKQEDLDRLENLKISGTGEKKIELLQKYFDENRITYKNSYPYGTQVRTIIEDIIDSDREISIDEEPELAFSELVQSNPDVKHAIQFSDYDEEIKQAKEYILSLKHPDFCNVESETLKNKLPELIFKLVDNGFIRINYRSIVNHFYGDENIQQFLNNILIDHEKQYDLLLDNPKDAYDKIEKSDFGKAETLNYDLIIWMFDNDKAELRKMLGSALEQNDGFIENLINRRPDIYDRVMSEIDPFFEFNLDLLSPIDVSGIVSNNLYRADVHNYQILVHWMKQKFFEVEEYISILNDEKISKGLKQEIVNSKPPMLESVDLNKINSDLWSLFVENKLLKPTNSNVNAYISEYGVTDELVDLVNKKELVTDEEIPTEYLIRFLKNEQLSDKSFNELFLNVEDIVPEELVDGDYYFIQKLFKENKVLIDDGIVGLIDRYGVKLPENYKNDDLRNQLINAEEKLQIDLVKELLNGESYKNEELFYAYLDEFEIDYTLASKYIDRDTREKLGYIVKKIKRYTTRTFTNTEYNTMLLNRLWSEGYIDGFEVKDNGRLKPTFKK
ncbi:YobI family P-loop NTPase [Fructobacillus fructosus]|uniref:YobI family P-loop NTPase n=1 Tax=Fructobacillus fructosus TaxID=1631 RepID=UPI0040337DB9